MPKILLVEDDNNLREIFQMRLQAEGYSTAVAADGEEGLVVAMKEKPDLIIADVMMPKLSGFEMVENLRSSPEMKDTKVIMMTALGQAEDQARGEKLGVVKYLVKSQVTLEDFARVVTEVLGPGDQPGAAAAAPAAQSTTNSQESENSMQDSSNPTPMPNDTPASDPAANNPAMPPADGGGAMPAADGQQSTAQEQTAVNDQINNFAASTPDASATPAGDTSVPADSSDAPADASAPAMPPATDAPASPAADPTAPADGSQPATPPVDPTTNAL
jgi:CheY-like chemotaxis protein